MNGKDLSNTAEMAERLIEDGFVNVEAHLVAAGAYTKLNQPEKARVHFAIATGLLRSITSTGDGKTTESAFEVISDREQYALLMAPGLPCSRDNFSVTPVAATSMDVEDWYFQRVRLVCSFRLPPWRQGQRIGVDESRERPYTESDRIPGTYYLPWPSPSNPKLK